MSKEIKKHLRLNLRLLKIAWEEEKKFFLAISLPHF